MKKLLIAGLALALLPLAAALAPSAALAEEVGAVTAADISDARKASIGHAHRAGALGALELGRSAFDIGVGLVTDTERGDPAGVIGASFSDGAVTFSGKAAATQDGEFLFGVGLVLHLGGSPGG